MDHHEIHHLGDLLLDCAGGHFVSGELKVSYSTLSYSVVLVEAGHTLDLAHDLQKAEFGELSDSLPSSRSSFSVPSQEKGVFRLVRNDGRLKNSDFT
ncbi:hypothetical protein M569_00022 [Genlisea aurea]|uniref:Uncharacterized protein n=1 Tax=Genlisea aurea TaxID=192259 RepID=S8EPB0_9LAMI|nr:hypothetical protein M569_00022 [Genlisea aurea]